jgi:hypothetical protein
MRPSLLLRRSISCVPGGKFQPGFDPNHIAVGAGAISGAGANLLSAASVGANMVNLLTGHKGTASTVTAVTDAPLGRISSIGAAGSVNFANSTTCPARMTFGAIIRITTSNTNALMSTSTGTGGMQMVCTGGTNLLYVQFAGSSGLPQTTPIVINIPWFVATSCDLTNTSNYLYSYVAVRLDTGQVYTTTGTTTSAGAGTLTPTQSGGANVGGWTTFGTTRFAAAMMSPIYMPLPLLLAWAADPWSFWYPTTPGIVGFDAELVGPMAAVGIPPPAINAMMVMP